MRITNGRRFAALAVSAALAVTAQGAAHQAAHAAGIDRVGITVGSLGNPYFVATDKGISSEAGKITPDAKLTFVSSDYDLNKQFTQIDNFIASGAKIIMINAVDPVAVLPAIKRAQNAGVTVAAFDVAAQGATLTVMTDNVKAGAISCQYIVDHLPGQKGNVVIVNGPQVSSIRDRVAGCKQVLAQHPGIKLLSSDQNAQASRDGGLAVGQSLLTHFPKIDAMFAINDPTAIGLNLAAKQLHRTDFIITSVDGAPDIVAELKDKTSLVKASAAQDPSGMAATAYRLAVAAVGGKKPEQAVTLLAPKLVTTENVDSYKGWGG
ncbi:ABC transporter substrate-binding protein [Rhizosaccharibacter radicis]|uniref:ABC transporter substrate-binding protein n=1 Tax=Rhizosaccharibacter radicis TaxID=2782605 RepID=A0ABT1W4B1_9PROT|nr:ABC transporter substrate-binding protein [Acetobacteraceae bacterium KSS12]